MREVRIEEVPEDLRKALAEEVEETARESGVRPDDVLIYEYPVIPVRIQHIVNELGREGKVLLSTTIINGRLYLLAVRRGSGDLHLAPDYGLRRGLSR